MKFVVREEEEKTGDKIKSCWRWVYTEKKEMLDQGGLLEPRLHDVINRKETPLLWMPTRSQPHLFLQAVQDFLKHVFINTLEVIELIDASPTTAL